MIVSNSIDTRNYLLHKGDALRAAVAGNRDDVYFSSA